MRMHTPSQSIGFAILLSWALGATLWARPPQDGPKNTPPPIWAPKSGEDKGGKGKTEKDKPKPKSAGMLQLLFIAERGGRSQQGRGGKQESRDSGQESTSYTRDPPPREVGNPRDPGQGRVIPIPERKKDKKK